MTTINGNGANGQTEKFSDLATIQTAIVQDREKRDRANRVRRINRQLVKGNRKLCSIKDATGVRRYYPVDTAPHNAIDDIEKLARQLGVSSTQDPPCHFKCGRQVERRRPDDYYITFRRGTDADEPVCSDCAEGLGYTFKAVGKRGGQQ
jgi:hypothetical protein